MAAVGLLQQERHLHERPPPHRPWLSHELQKIATRLVQLRWLDDDLLFKHE